MKRAQQIIEQATNAARAHRQACGMETISYSYLAGVLESHVVQLCRELADFETPEREDGELSTTFTHEGGELVVHYKITDTYPGKNLRPDVHITGVYANGMDIQFLLADADILYEIEEACENDAQQRETDRAEHYADLAKEAALEQKA